MKNMHIAGVSITELHVWPCTYKQIMLLRLNGKGRLVLDVVIFLLVEQRVRHLPTSSDMLRSWTSEARTIRVTLWLILPHQTVLMYLLFFFISFEKQTVSTTFSFSQEGSFCSWHTAVVLPSKVLPFNLHSKNCISQNGWGCKGTLGVVLSNVLLKQSHIEQAAEDHVQTAFKHLQG